MSSLSHPPAVLAPTPYQQRLSHPSGPICASAAAARPGTADSVRKAGSLTHRRWTYSAGCALCAEVSAGCALCAEMIDSRGDLGSFSGRRRSNHAVFTRVSTPQPSIEGAA